MKYILRSAILVISLTGFANLYAQPGCPEVTTNTHVFLPCGQNCTTLNASAFSAAETTSYVDSAIAWNPPFAFNTGTSVLVHTDDLWSSVINLPFNFCFFGNTYNQFIIGSNGVISFSTGNAGVFNSWSITGTAPTNNPADVTNAIMAPWQDMDPTNAGNIYYNIGGTYPCRHFEVSWYHCPMYGDASSVNTGYCLETDRQTQMAVLYETTNAIEIYIQTKAAICDDAGAGYWNGGLAVEGLINAAGTVAYTVPGRNATQFGPLSDDAWRFTPSGNPNYTITWFQGTTQIGTGNNVTVCPTVATAYTVSATYTNCDNSAVVVSDSVFVGLSGLTATASQTPVSCNNGSNGSVTANYNTTSGIISYGWAPGGAGQTTLTGLSPGTYVFTVSDSAGCTARDTEVIANPTLLTVNVPDTILSSCSGTGNGGALTAHVTGGTGAYTYKWSDSLTTQTISGLINGTYTVTVTDAHGCSATASALVSISITGLTIGPPVIREVSCFGGNNGSIVEPETGGAPPFTYTWSPGGTSTTGDSLSGLSAGTYNLTVTDRFGCSATATFNITQAPAIVIDTAKVIPVRCSTNGSISITASGGTGTLSYTWSPNVGTTDSIGNLTAGIYKLTITDQNLCSLTASYTIAPGSNALIIDSSKVINVSCNGGNNGAIAVYVGGGSGTIHYVWSVPGSTNTISALSAGTYTVTATDSLGCSVTGSDTVLQPLAVVITSDSITPITCYGDSNGSITIVAGGGTGALKYTWGAPLSGDSTATATGLMQGTYTVTAHDVNGCSTSASYTIGQPAQIVIDSIVTTQVGCTTGGSIVVTAHGGTGTLAYTWSTAQSGDSIGNLAGGVYKLTITDQNGCSITASDTITASPGAISFSTPVLTEPSCHGGNNGSITDSALGGTGTLTYIWSVGGIHGDSIAGLTAGIYTLTVTDIIPCSASTSFVLNQPSSVTFNAPVITEPSCNGGNNGTITVSAAGGTGTITYRWSYNNDSTATITGLSMGTYTVTASDSLGCTGTASYTVGQPLAITFGTPVIDSISCNGGSNGSITVDASGGTGTITYRWTYHNDSTATITGLAQGAYTVTATDTLGCSATASYTVSQPAPITIDTAIIDSATCALGGSIHLIATGGTGTLVYHWSNSASGDSITNVSGGPINVTITDQNLCTASAAYIIPSAPNTVTIDSAILTDTRCHGSNNGSITVIVSGGLGTIKYHWNYLNDSTATISGLAAGIYAVTITDSVGCSASTSYTLGQPSQIVIDSSIVTPATCTIGGCIRVIASGGTGTLQYLWSNFTIGDSVCGLSGGSRISIVITDSLLCLDTANYLMPTAPNTLAFDTPVITEPRCNGNSNGSITVTTSGGVGIVTYKWNYNNDSTATITSLSIGTYIVTATDTNGCSVSASYQVNQPATLTINSFVTTNPTCSASGSIHVIATGGTGALTYSWLPGPLSGDSITGLAGGIYSVTVSDQNGCSASATDSVGTAPPPIVITAAVVDSVICFGGSTGSIVITDSGGLGTTIYNWSNGQTTATDAGLVAGNYCVTVSDAAGCSATACYTVGQPPALTAAIIYKPVICPGSTDTATVNAAGGTPGYAYLWSNDSTTQTVNALSAGVASVTVIDIAGCTVTQSATILQAPLIVDTVSIDSNLCHGVNGSAVIRGGGGAGTLTYTVNPGALVNTSGQFSNLAPGTYNYSISDTLGCSTGGSFVVPQGLPLDSFAVTSDSVSCFGGSDGELIVLPVDSQNAPFSYSLNGGAFQAGNIFDSLTSGAYQVVVNDHAGCLDTLSASVGQPAVETVTFELDTITATATIGVLLKPQITNFVDPVYVWTPAMGLSCTNCADPTATVSTPTIYYVTVSDSLNSKCAITDSIVILMKSQFKMPDAFTPNGDGKNDFFGPVQYSYAVVKAFRIYNRWGQLVHNSIEYWDGNFNGKPQPPGTYAYYIEVEYPDPINPDTTDTIKQEGAVTLLR